MTAHRSAASAEAVLFRLGLAIAGGLLVHLAFSVADTARLSTSPGGVSILVAAGLAGLCLLAAAALSAPPDGLRWLILAAYVGQVLIQSFIWVQASHLPDLILADPGLYADAAGEILRQGENPYAWDFGGVYDLYRTGQEASTPRLNAAPESNFPYPALSFLLVVPFQALGLPGVFALSVMVHAAVLTLLFAASPRGLQPVVLAPLMAGFDLIALTLIGNLDIIWVGLLVAMALAWRRPALRAVLFGLAAALKQTPWLLLPFLIIRLWRDDDSQRPLLRVRRFLVVSGTTFLLVNGPFILWDLKAWLQGVTEPLRDDLVFLSQGGLSTLTQFGFAYLPKGYFLAATLSVLVLLVFVYWRHYGALRDAFWIMPAVFMWFSFRSLVSYWLYWAFPMLVTLARRFAEEGPASTPPPRGPSWRPTLAVAAGTMLVVAGLGAWLAATASPVHVRVRPPMLSTAGRIDRLTVEVTNASRRILAPRFAVQGLRTVLNPLPWYILEGPSALAPGERAAYEIASQRDDRTFFAQEAVQLVVTDAGGDYTLRGVATIQPDRSYLWPDAIPDPAYRLWREDGRAPTYWGLIDEPAGAGSAALVQKDDRQALELRLDASSQGLNRVALANFVIFPARPFGIWVQSDSPPQDSSSIAYGLEIADGPRRLWILFGSEPYAGPVAEGLFVIHRLIPPRAWTYEEIDLAAAYAQAGWALPGFQRHSYRGLDVDLRLVDLRLLLAAPGPRGPLRAYFGPIEQDYRVQPRDRMQETLDNPRDYYLRLAESHRQDRNYAHVLEALQRALQFAPDDPEILNQIDRVRQHLAEEAGQ